MKKITHFLFLAVFAVYFAACSNGTIENPETETPTIVTADDWEGTYGYGNREGTEGGGFLAMAKNEAGDLKFELEIQEGDPNRHSGRATGVAKLTEDNKKAVWMTKEFGQPCKLTFTLLAKEGTVAVNQEQGTDFDCGFGAGVSASEEFQKKSDTPTFPFEKEMASAMNNISENVAGVYRSGDNVKTPQTLTVEKLADNKIKVKSTIYTEGKEFEVMEEELNLEGNKAVYQAQKGDKTCRVTFSFLANGKVDIRQEVGAGCTFVADMTEVLLKAPIE